MDPTQPFRGSAALRCGAVTRGVLIGPRYRRLQHDIYVTADREVDLALRSLAALLVVERGGVLSGYSAAELLEASSGPLGTPRR